MLVTPRGQVYVPPSRWYDDLIDAVDQGWELLRSTMSRPERRDRAARQAAVATRTASGPGRDGESADAALMRRIASGDQAAMAEIYGTHGRATFSIAVRVLNETSLAEDVVQAVFLRLWDEPTRFDADRGALRSFLFREAQSRAIERVRAEEARRAREERGDREDHPIRIHTDIEGEVVDLVRSERVREAMQSLTDGERDAINLAYFGGHTYRDVARLLDLPEGTVKSRIRIGLTKLADRLEELGWGGPDDAR